MGDFILDRADCGNADAGEGGEFDVAVRLLDQRFELCAERGGAEAVEAGVHVGQRLKVTYQNDTLL
ncbi:hypothetical protein [Burkholderia ubonensis]|uniref:hypothetical protein n=1 Tax=Burkholderia ubonensis TaxID=101571 RepID=UPI001E2AB8C3|nr:hypothetical protein [Burkholderia ubonensis]